MIVIESGNNWRVCVVPDEVEYDDSYIDTWDETPEEVERLKKELWERISREGVWGLVAEVKCPLCDNWNLIDSVGGFIGCDWDDDYKDDLIATAKDKANRTHV